MSIILKLSDIKYDAICKISDNLYSDVYKLSDILYFNSLVFCIFSYILNLILQKIIKFPFFYKIFIEFII